MFATKITDSTSVRDISEAARREAGNVVTAEFHKERAKPSVSPCKCGWTLVRALQTLLAARHGGLLQRGP